MTEPNVGSSLGDLTTKAIPQSDGSYKIKGQKMFISGGDQDITENIVHLVLARIQDAPQGKRYFPIHRAEIQNQYRWNYR